MPLSPNTLLLQTGLVGNLNSIAVDDTTWLTAQTDNTNVDLAVGFPTPLNPPTVGAGLQKFIVKHRVTPNGSTLTFNAYLRENGVRLNGGATIDSWTSNVTTEATREILWNAALLSDPTGAGVEIEIECASQGGNPSIRTSGEFQYVQWVNDPDDANLNIPATSDSISFSENQQTVSINIKTEITVEFDELTFTEYLASIEEGVIELFVSTDNITVSEQAAELSINYNIFPTTGSISLQELDSQVNFIKLIDVTTEALNFTEYNPVYAGVVQVIKAGTDSFSFTENDSELSLNLSFEASTEFILVQEYNTLSRTVFEYPTQVDSITVTEYDQELSRHITVFTETSDLSIQEIDPDLSISLLLDVLSPQSLEITEYQADIFRKTQITAEFQTIEVSSSSVELSQNNFITTLNRDELNFVEFNSFVNIALEIPVLNLEEITVTERVAGLSRTFNLEILEVENLEVKEHNPTINISRRPRVIASDLLQLDPGALVTFYELDLSGFGEGIFYLHPGVNELKEPVVWGGIEYSPFPIEATGFDVTGNGEIPRPRVIVSNILGTLGSLVRSYDDLVGAKLVRRRTFVKYLDEVNFAEGNILADPSAEFVPDVYFIDRKVTETNAFIEFELSSSWDVQGIKLPRRQIIQNMCAWAYRSSECGYAGGAVADERDNPTNDITRDRCSKSLTGCTLRFGEQAVLPFGGFPAAGLIDA